ncbi:unnamed protein product [Rotaria sp. Silwood1]|nr:unnamed protein product [Rotaria sp. Silwood1]
MGPLGPHNNNGVIDNIFGLAEAEFGYECVVGNTKLVPPTILTLVSWQEHIGLVLDVGIALILPASPPGRCSSNIQDVLFNISTYTSAPCIPGTARNTTSFGPCLLCPSNMKSNGSGAMECHPCQMNNSLCLRGSVYEINKNKLSNYDQAEPYPDSPDITEFDDILLHNIFLFRTTSPSCLAISPLFWATLTIALSFIILIVMIILTYFPEYKNYRILLKTIFKRFDLLKEGELWLGGLVSIIIIVLIIFTCRFSNMFLNLYPIETTSHDARMAVSCDSSLFNAKFITSLQLLSIHKHEQEQPIFDILDQQHITLTVHFIGTAHPCTSVSMQQNMDRGQSISSTDFNCSFDNENFILSVSTLLPQHRISVEFNLKGPYFVGGFRLCLSGPSKRRDENKYIVQELDFCQMFSPLNETLTVNALVNIKMTKTINRTMGMSMNDDLMFGGLWLPKLSVTTLSDALVYIENGEYLRYLPERTRLIIDMSESDFFVQNTQEPIALEIPRVTEASVSGDDAVHLRQQDCQWTIVVSSMLADAIGLAPYIDAFLVELN